LIRLNRVNDNYPKYLLALDFITDGTKQINLIDWLHIKVRTLRQYVPVAVADIFPLVMPFADIELTTSISLIADNASVCFCDCGFPLSNDFRKFLILQYNKKYRPVPYVPKSGFCLKI